MKRKSNFRFWAAVFLSAIFGAAVFSFGAAIFADSFVFIFFYPMVHYFLAAFVYELLSARESVLRSFFVGLASFNLTVIALALFAGGYLFLIPLGLTLFAVTGFLGTSIGFLSAIVLKGNQVRLLP